MRLEAGVIRRGSSRGRFGPICFRARTERLTISLARGYAVGRIASVGRVWSVIATLAATAPLISSCRAPSACPPAEGYISVVALHMPPERARNLAQLSIEFC